MQLDVELPLSESAVDDRLQQIAAIFARGVCRYLCRLHRSEARAGNETANSTANALERVFVN